MHHPPRLGERPGTLIPSADATRMPSESESPVEDLDTNSRHREPEDGLALCLSGGGYRAMVFHAGVLWRLNELGYLKRFKRISSVSGGSITAAMLGLRWSSLAFTRAGVAENFGIEVVRPIRRMAGRTIDVESVLSGILTPGTIADKVVGAYKKHLFGEATLQDLPDDPPRFVINATNVQSGALWRFMKPAMRDYRVGAISAPTIPLAVAVAASSAFPPVLSPLQLELREEDYDEPTGKEDLHYEPYTTDVFLTDGGVYDNLGLETAWKRYRSIFVSDAGGKMSPEAEPKTDWARHSKRVLDLIDNQVRNLRKRQVIDAFDRGERTGAYWGIRTDAAKFGDALALDCPIARTRELADLKTRLERLDADVQERLINWGYAVCDAAVRCHYDPQAPRPAGFPFPRGV